MRRKPIEKTPVEMIGILPDSQFKIAKDFVDLGEKLNCRPNTRYATKHKEWKCTFTRRKPPTILLYTIECNEQHWHVRTRLWHIDTYCDFLGTCSEKMKNVIKSGHKCSGCNPDCNGGPVFLLEGIKYKMCTFCSFDFSDLSTDEWKNLMSIIEKEYEAANRAV